MKMRTGFVSNSSAASFIVHWRYKTMGEKMNFKETLSNLFHTYNYDEEKSDVVWDDTWEKFKETFAEIEKQTQENPDGTYTSTFYTIMYNDLDDFGEAAKSLVMAAVIENVIIDAKVEDE